MACLEPFLSFLKMQSCQTQPCDDHMLTLSVVGQSISTPLPLLFAYDFAVLKNCSCDVTV